MFYKLSDAALVVKLMRALGFFAFILDRDADALVEKGLFSEPLRKFVKAINGMVKDLGVRFERDLRATPPGLAGLLQPGHGNPPDVVLLVSFCVPPNLKM